MSNSDITPFFGEELISLADAAYNFGGASIPLATVRKYVYRGVGGVKLETVLINQRLTSQEAIQRFIKRKQGSKQSVEKPTIKMMTQAEVDAGLKKYGLIKQSLNDTQETNRKAARRVRRRNEQSSNH